MAAKRKLNYAKRSVKRSKVSARRSKKRAPRIKYSPTYGFRKQPRSIKDFHKYLGKTLSSATTFTYTRNGAFPAIYSTCIKKRVLFKYKSTTNPADHPDAELFSTNTADLQSCLNGNANNLTEFPGYSLNNQARGRDQLASIYDRYIVSGAKVTVKMSNFVGSDTNNNHPEVDALPGQTGGIKRVDAIKFWCETQYKNAANKTNDLQRATDRRMKIKTLYPKYDNKNQKSVSFSFWIPNHKYAVQNESSTIGEALSAAMGAPPNNSPKFTVYGTDEEGNKLIAASSNTNPIFEVDLQIKYYVTAYRVADAADGPAGNSC